MERKAKKELKTNISPKSSQIILASSSKTRLKILKKYSVIVEAKPHKVNEREIKKKMKNVEPSKIVSSLAKLKAESLSDNFTNKIIIGSDQILVFKNKIYDKPQNLEQATNNLLKLQGNEHMLISSIYILKNKKFIWKTTQKAKIFMKKCSVQQIKEYVSLNSKIVLDTVGSYKIEDNVLKNIIVLKGNKETVQGFPIKNFINKFTLTQ